MSAVLIGGIDPATYGYNYVDFSLPDMDLELVTDEVEDKVFHFGSYVKSRTLQIQLYIQNSSKDFRVKQRRAMENAIVLAQQSGALTISFDGMTLSYSGFFKHSSCDNTNNCPLENLVLEFEVNP